MSDVVAGDVQTPPVKKKKECLPEGKQFEVCGEVFRRFSLGRNKFERWNKFLDREDPKQNEIYEFIKKNRGTTVILKNEDNGAMVSLRRRSSNSL